MSGDGITRDPAALAALETSVEQAHRPARARRGTRGADALTAAPPVPRPRRRNGEEMKRPVVLTVVVIAVLTGGLALYLSWLGTLLNRIADNLEDSADLVRNIDDNAKVIRPCVAHINEVGGVVAGALPLLYGMAEQVVQSTAAESAIFRHRRSRNSRGTRRSRHHDQVGFIPPG